METWIVCTIAMRLRNTTNHVDLLNVRNSWTHTKCMTHTHLDTYNRALVRAKYELNELKEKLVRFGGNLSQLHTFENLNVLWSIKAIEIHHKKCYLCKKRELGILHICIHIRTHNHFSVRCWRVCACASYLDDELKMATTFFIYYSNKLLCAAMWTCLIFVSFGFGLVATFLSPLFWFSRFNLGFSRNKPKFLIWISVWNLKR